MKASQITCTTAAILLLGFVVPAFARAGAAIRRQEPSEAGQQAAGQARGAAAQQPRPSTREAQPARQPQQTKETPERSQPQQRQAPQQAKESRQRTQPQTRQVPQPQQAKESPRTQPQQRQAPQQERPAVSRQEEHTAQQRTSVPAQRTQPSNTFSKLPGSSIGRETGSRTTARGNSAAAITATAFRTRASAAISERSTDSGSRVCRSWWWADIRGSSTTAIG